MWIDIRLPIGMLFSVFGIILSLFGLLGGDARYEISLGINVNLIWGLVLLVFGIFMFVLGKSAKKAIVPNEEPEGPQTDGRPRH